MNWFSRRSIYATFRTTQSGTGNKNNKFCFSAPASTIVHPCMYLMEVTEVKYIPKSVYNKTHMLKSIQGHNICLTISDHDYILDGIKRRGEIKYERNINL